MLCLKQALEDLNYEYVEAEAGVEVRGYLGQLEKAELVIRASKTYDVGVRQTADGIELIADWWGVETTRGLTEEEFVNQLTQRYAYHKVIKEVKARGFSIEQDEEENETIQLTVRKWL
jgi:predicted transcriptional regulator